MAIFYLVSTDSLAAVSAVAVAAVAAGAAGAAGFVVVLCLQDEELLLNLKPLCFHHACQHSDHQHFLPALGQLCHYY